MNQHPTEAVELRCHLGLRLQKQGHRPLGNRCHQRCKGHLPQAVMKRFVGNALCRIRVDPVEGAVDGSNRSRFTIAQ